MSSSIFNKLASSRRMVSTVFTVPHAVSDSLVSSPARKISFHHPTFLTPTLETQRRPPDSVLFATLYQPGREHQPDDLNGGQDWLGSKLRESENLVYDLRSDYLEQHSGLDSLYFDAMFWKSLTSDQRFKDLGVYYKPAPIPDRNEWKASWCQEGKPNWLGTVPTQADKRLWHTAIIDGFIDKEGGKGGYAVIIIDNYTRPKVAVVGYSSEGSLVFNELQGIRAALQVALDTGLGPHIQLTCRSREVGNLFTHFSDFEDLDTFHRCYESYSESHHGDESCICLACEGLHLLKHFSTEDSEVLYPVINKILQLRHKLGPNIRVSKNLSQASTLLGKCYGTPTTEEMKLFQFLDGEYEVYEMVMKPDKFSEEVVDALYDDCFKGYRYYGQHVLEELVPGPIQMLSAPTIFKNMRHQRALLTRRYT
ncbi:hypothetical protein MKX03_036316 [Papaver bracteatum]|nr:hypothetical protein MKX03_036316 [Papaver bracteatum]